jgi:uncharacterized protein involved in exopolysaccharide biosynthesis
MNEFESGAGMSDNRGKKLKMVHREKPCPISESDLPDGNDKVLPGLDFLALLSLLLRRKKWIISTVSAVMVAAVLIVLLIPNKYISSASILPSGNVDNMAALKDLTGFGNTIIKDENSSDLYPVILRSRLILDAVLNETYAFTHNSKALSLTLDKYFKTENADKLRAALTGITAVATDKKKGVIYISVETRYPGLSLAIVASYLAELENYNRHYRKSQAKENADYLARQLSEAENELKQAEDKLAGFQNANRDWYRSNHPDIVNTLARLQLEVEIKSKKYAYLSQEYEAAMFEAQKDMPIVRLLDPPSLPKVKSSPRRLFSVILAGIVSFFGSIFAVLLAEAFNNKRQGSDRTSYDEFIEELQDIPVINRIVHKLSENKETSVKK